MNVVKSIDIHYNEWKKRKGVKLVRSEQKDEKDEKDEDE